MEETARKHQTELQIANSRAAMAKLAGTATKLTQTLELSPILQFLIRDRLGKHSEGGEFTTTRSSSDDRGGSHVDGWMDGWKGEGLTAAGPGGLGEEEEVRASQMGTKMGAFPAAVR